MPVVARRVVLPTWAALASAAVAGLLLDAGFPDRGIWPLPFVGVGIILIALIGRGIGGALLVGFVGGGSFYLAHIQWASLFLGPLPMSALVVLQALLFALGCVPIALAYRWVPRVWPDARLLLPLVVAGLWILREALTSSWPYGGFSWGRLAMSQSESPFKELFSWVGISGVSFLMVLLIALVVDPLRQPTPSRLRRGILPVLVVVVLVTVPGWSVPTVGTMRVAAIQGNGPAGYFDDRDPGALLAAQYDATLPVLGQDLDVVLWPEGATDRSPLEDADTAAVFDRISEQAGAPLVGWAITQRGGLTYNTQILWNAGDGAVDLYDKRHPVPFGEYVPDRGFWRPFAPELIDLVQRDYTPGSLDPIFDIDGVPAGVNICFDIADDQVLRDSVLQGAQVIFAASNNADFGRTDQSAQQLAIARIRALELGRTVVNVSTVGLTAIVGPDGRTVAELPWHTPGSIIADVELAQSLTPAALIGRMLEWLLAGLAAGVLLVAAPWRPFATAAHRLGPSVGSSSAV
ncbi:MAG: apolipoprotein N-acyltransferase [Cryobacterium sp.]|nr:apolipoprotein N-acyltransferase [Cryobacterium sp.]